MCGRDIEKSICREMSGNVESGMVAVGMFSRFLNLNRTLAFQKHVETPNIISVSKNWIKKNIVVVMPKYI